MITLIHSACMWGRDNYSQWILVRAELDLYSAAPPVNCETRLKKGNKKMAFIQTNGYDNTGRLVQSLTLALTAPEFLYLHSPSPDPFQSIKPDDKSTTTIIFTRTQLNEFLKKSGDTNNLHFGKTPVVPGLWILQRMRGLYPMEASTRKFSIRFLRPVFLDQKILLCCSENRVMGVYNGRPYFIMDTLPSLHSTT